MKVFELFLDGLRIIAKSMREEPALAMVEEISGTSPLVLKFVRMIERFGFVVERDEGGAVIETGRWVKCGKMAMSREEFLRRF